MNNACLELWDITRVKQHTRIIILIGPEFILLDFRYISSRLLITFKRYPINHIYKSIWLETTIMHQMLNQGKNTIESLKQ